MSTKIYYAWRAKPCFFDDFLTKYRKFCYKNAKKLFFNLIGDIGQDSIIKYIDNYNINRNVDDLKPYPQNDEDIQFWKTKIALQEAIYSSFSPYKFDTCIIDCSLNVWFYKNYFYIIPYCNFTISEFVKPKYTENFCYYDNTDKPKNISKKDWGNRAKIWNEVCLNDWNLRRMTYEVIDMKTYNGVAEFCKNINLNSLKFIHRLSYEKRPEKSK